MKLKKIFKRKHIKSDIVPYEKSRKIGMRVRNNYSFDPEITGLVAHHLIHKLQETELKQKIKAGHRVRVCFLIDTATRLSAGTVYEHMKNHKLFKPFMVLYQSFDDRFDMNPTAYEEHLRDLETLRKKGYTVYDGYDKNGNFIQIDEFSPDIVFLTAPYLDYQETYLSNIYLNLNFLTCYLTYGINSSNSYAYHYNNRRISSCWKYFVETRTDYEELIRYSAHCGTNAVLTGYPKLDVYAKPLADCKIPKKIDNGKPIVIYAPHHSIKADWEPSNIATFHLYYDKMLEMVKNNPDINFVFKPHPNLVFSVENKNIMTAKEYQDYIRQWENLPNGICVQDGEYIELFRHSDLLIMDCGSFIAEWLPTGKPCMYLVNPERDLTKYMDGFSLLCRKILDKYYLCYSQEDINNYFNQIMKQHIDTKSEERIKLVDEIFINIGTAGHTIVNKLEKILL